eukprot:1860187-Rhodomonas_salina.1
MSKRERERERAYAVHESFEVFRRDVRYFHLHHILSQYHIPVLSPALYPISLPISVTFACIILYLSTYVSSFHELRTLSQYRTPHTTPHLGTAQHSGSTISHLSTGHRVADAYGDSRSYAMPGTDMAFAIRYVIAKLDHTFFFFFFPSPSSW